MPRDPSLRQRGNRRYSFADHGNSTMGQRQGKYVVRNNLADHWNPTYGDGVTTIRIFPQKNVDDPSGYSWDPYRFSSEPGNFGDWIRRYPAVRNFGEPGVTFIMADPADPTALDPQMLPAVVLFNAIDRAVANQQEQQGWAGMLRGGRGRSAQLSRPSEIYLVQCSVMQHKQQVYGPPKGFGPEDKLIVMELSGSAGVAMVTEMNKVVEGSQAPEGDWENQMVNGDPVSLDTGRFVTFYKLADGDPRHRGQATNAGWNQPQQGMDATGQQQEPIGYGCYLEPTMNDMPARLREYEETIAQKVRSWDDILWFPTVEEQAHLIADKFPPSAVMYAFRDRPEWIPETLKNRAVAQTVVAPPENGWQPSQPGVAGPPAQPGWGAPPVGPQPAGEAQVTQPPATTPAAQPAAGFQGGFPAPAAAPPAQAPPAAAPPVQAPPVAAPPAQAPQPGFGMPQQPPVAATAPAGQAQAPAPQPAQSWMGAANPAAPPAAALPAAAPPAAAPPAAAPPAAAPPAAAPPAAVQPQGQPQQQPGFALQPTAPVTDGQMTRAQAALAAAQSAAAGPSPPPAAQ